MYIKYYPSGVFSCQRHICTTLTRNWVVVLMNVLPVHIQYKSIKKSVPRGTLLLNHSVLHCVYYSIIPILFIFRVPLISCDAESYIIKSGIKLAGEFRLILFHSLLFDGWYHWLIMYISNFGGSKFLSFNILSWPNSNFANSDVIIFSAALMSAFSGKIFANLPIQME